MDAGEHCSVRSASVVEPGGKTGTGRVDTFDTPDVLILKQRNV
jgi:hypothetical protein